MGCKGRELLNFSGSRCPTAQLAIFFKNNCLFYSLHKFPPNYSNFPHQKLIPPCTKKLWTWLFCLSGFITEKFNPLSIFVFFLIQSFNFVIPTKYWNYFSICMILFVFFIGCFWASLNQERSEQNCEYEFF